MESPNSYKRLLGLSIYTGLSSGWILKRGTVVQSEEAAHPVKKSPDLFA